MPKVGTKLAKVLQEEGRRQDWLAEQVGVDQSLISRYVHGLTCPPQRQEQIARVLGRPVSECF